MQQGVPSLKLHIAGFMDAWCTGGDRGPLEHGAQGTVVTLSSMYVTSPPFSRGASFKVVFGLVQLARESNCKAVWPSARIETDTYSSVFCHQHAAKNGRSGGSLPAAAVDR